MVPVQLSVTEVEVIRVATRLVGAPGGKGEVFGVELPNYVRARDAARNISLASNTVRATVPVTSSPPPAAPPTCRVTYTSQAQWARGFVAGITIANTGQTATNGWTLTFTFGGDQQITGS